MAKVDELMHSSDTAATGFTAVTLLAATLHLFPIT